MGDPARPLPPGFDSLSVEEQIGYVQELWDRIAADADRVPVPEWHRDVLKHRVEAYRLRPQEVESWEEVRERISRKLQPPQE